MRDQDTYYPRDLVEKMSAALRVPGSKATLREVQARALYDLARGKKGFYPIRVGGGKTLISFLAPRVLGSARCLLVLPAALLEKTDREWRKAKEDWQVARHLQFRSYEKLGRVSGATDLDLMKPDLILADEAHRLKNPRAAVTRRFARYMAANPKTRFIPMTGTLMKNSVKDFAHLMAWALGETSVLPTDREELDAWAGALDEGLNPVSRRSPGVLLDLIRIPDDGSDDDDNSRRARKVFFARANATEGVIVADSQDDYQGSLLIEGIEYEPNAATENNFKILRETMCKPDGWALGDAMQVWAEARRLALGIHYTWWTDSEFKKWVASHPKKPESTTGDGASAYEMIQNFGPKRTPNNAQIEMNILKSVAHMTASAIAVQQALAARTPKPQVALDIAMGLRPSNTPISADDMMGRAICVEKSPENLSLAARFSQWTTTTQPDEFAACFASPATAQSVFWEILLRAWPGLLLTLQAASQAAGPPEAWLQARKLWAAFVRDTLKSPRAEHMGWDSELQVTTAVLSGQLEDEYGLLADWQKIKPTFTIDPKPVWHDDTALKFCAQWLSDRPRGICWVEHRFFGAQLAKDTGLPYYGPKGLDPKGNFIEDASGPIIASVAANSNGRNLQFKWCDNLVTAPAADSERWEQMLARTHRYRQPADSVSVDVLVGCREHLESIPRALDSADVKTDLLGFSQKLRLADIAWISDEGKKGPRWA